MLDPKQWRGNEDAYRTRLLKRGPQWGPLFDELIESDKTWRDAIQKVDQLKHEQKELTPKGKPTPEMLAALKAKSDEIKSVQDTARLAEANCQELALSIPNVPDDSVPVGSSETDNVAIHTVGTPRSFSFTPKAHDELGISLGILNFEDAAKITGSRFAIYQGWGARLERALINFMLDTHAKIHGYTEIMPPAIVNSKSLYGTGQLPKFADDLFKLEGTDYFLSSTGEVQLTNILSESIVDTKDLPIKYVTYTPCFRKEAGSHGRDVKGLIRLHQFNKVELVNFTHPEESAAQLEQLTQEAETILKLLGLPFRRMVLCTGDLGFSATKTFDLEVWFPSQNKYREISSCSNFLDFQARRAMIRYRDSDKKVDYLHTLNGSGLAVGRCTAAILENFQEADGSITIPDCLRDYMGVESIPCLTA